MKQLLDRIAPYLPWFGLLLMAIGAVAYFVTRQWDLATNIPLASGLLLLLLFAVARPDDVRQLMSGRQARYGTSTFLSVVFFAVIGILLYYITSQNPDWRYDATATNEFTPLSETVELLQSLDKPVHVIGFYGQQASFQKPEAQKLLDSLKAYTSQLTYEFVDPNQNPLLAQEYELAVDGRLVFTSGEGEDQVYAVSPSLSDTDIHASLLKIINPVTKKLYIATGHGERAIDDQDVLGLSTIKELLEEAGFTIETLNLFVEGAVPADATAVLLIDQQAPMTPAEVFALRDYLNRGGTAFIARDVIDSDGRALAEEDDLNIMLQEDWGVAFRNDIVVEPLYVQAGQQFSFLAAEYGFSTITQDMDQYGTAFDLARSIELTPVEGVVQTSLASTSQDSWGETDFELLSTQGALAPDPEDAAGPLTVAASLEKTETGSRLVVFGDADFASNNMVLLGGNSLMITNALNWLADDELSVQLTPRETITRQVLISQSQLGLLQVMSVCLGPSIMAVIGIVVWYTRRQKK